MACRVPPVPDAVFEREGDLFHATELARGPWDPAAQHGGAPAALLMRALERLQNESGGELLLARVTYEFLRPVPLGRLRVAAQTVRAGRRAALLEGTIENENGVELVRARAVRVKRAEMAEGAGPLADTDSPQARAGPQAATPAEFFPTPERPMFAMDAMEIRFVAGGFAELGPARAWFRMRVPLVAGEPASPLQRVAAAADFGNGISSIVPWENHLFINPDLTLYVGREPAGEWTQLDARTRILPGGIGLAESVLEDERGAVGHATQALVVAGRG